MLRPLIILTILTALGLSSVLLLPEQIYLLPSAVKPHWPEKSGDWVKIRDSKPSPQEIAILAKDTGFFKAEYIHAQAKFHLDVGVVLSGEDPNNSIHRPERCLVAQGHRELTPSELNLPLNNGESLPVIRLFTRIEREIPTESGVPELVKLNFLTYYWFVGNETLTGSHYTRTAKDMTDRLMQGANQRWAYFTVSIALSDTPATRALADSQNGGTEYDRMIQDFLKTVIPEMIDFEMIKNTN